MKYIKNSLTVIAFVVAGFAAFAFQAPEADEAQMLFGKLDNGQWVPVQEDYICEIVPKRICTAELVNNDPQRGEPIPGTETEGRYDPSL